MKYIIYAVFIILTLINIYFGSYPMMKGEVHFFNDVARDFLLYREIDEKKIMLIGPRSNASGLYHGPLWSYMNYPVYLMSNGNPVAVAWFWSFLGVAAVTAGFFICRKLFGLIPALSYILLYSAHIMTHTFGMFHSDAPVYFTPLFFFTAYLYAKSKKSLYLILHLAILAIIIQLNIGVGTPLMILTTGFCFFQIIRNRTFKHLFSFLIIPLLLLNFIVFDFRHDHLLSVSAYKAWQFNRTWNPLSLDFWIMNRVNETVNLHIIQNQNILVWLIFAAVLITSIIEIRKNRKLRTVYIMYIYYYLGYMLLTFMNKGVILSHFVYLLGPLTIMWFVSLIRDRYRLIFLPLLAIAAFSNFQYGWNFINYIDNSFIEKLPWSWKSTNTVAESIIKKQTGKPEFGYFVFSPDAFAYGPRYAMIYHFKAAGLQAYEYTKKPVTYVVASPPPDNDPYMTYEWWVKNPVGIKKDSVWMDKFAGGYTALEYHLTEEEQKIPHDKTIELGIHFR
jgi:hypothetical protein